MNSGELSNNLIYIFSRAVDLDRPAILRWESWMAMAVAILPLVAIAIFVFVGACAIDALRSREVAK